ncbi:MAG: outer membrane beta-barrel family protein, partial [Bacteroidales bacterium]|nr:outer membrane beta-barrel family protein [Bacteroidales bacterium]
MPGADRTFSLTERRNYEHKSKPEVSFYGQFLPDSVTWITVRGGWSYEKSRNTERQRNAVYDGDPYAFSRHPLDQAFATENLADADGAPTSRSLYRTTTWQEAMNANASLGVRRLLPKKGQLNVGASVSFTDRTSDVLAERDLRFRYDPEANELRYETDHRPEQSLKTSADARYQVWLGKKLLLKMGYEFTHSRDNDRQQHSVTEAAAAPDADEETETTDPNSYHRRQTSDRHDATLAATLNLGSVSLMPQVQLQHRREHLTYVRGVLDVDRQRYENLWQPQLTMRWKVKRGQSVEADYSLRTDLPDLLETVPYVDDINPLFVSQGNPLLRRTHYHSAGLRYFANITKQQRVFSLSLNYDRRLHPLSAMYFYNEQTGAYRRMMANAGSGTEWNGRVSYEQAAGDYVRLQNILNAGHQRSHGFLTADYDAATAAPNLRKCFFIEDSPTISFEQDKLLLKLGASYRFNRLRYAPQAASNQSLTDYGLEFTARYKWKILTAETNLELEGHKGYSATDMNRARPDWSFTLYCKVLHGKGNVALEFDDILNQQRWYSATQ